MSSSGPFRVVDHVVECQHIREYPGATAHEQEEELHLAVKQYIPIDNPNPQPGDVTILAAHANGFPKVCQNAGGKPFPRGASAHRPIRNCTNLSGRRSMPGPRQMGSGYAASGWQMSRTRARAVWSTRIFWEMTVSILMTTTRVAYPTPSQTPSL